MHDNSVSDIDILKWSMAARVMCHLLDAAFPSVESTALALTLNIIS